MVKQYYILQTLLVVIFLKIEWVQNWFRGVTRNFIKTNEKSLIIDINWLYRNTRKFESPIVELNAKLSWTYENLTIFLKISLI